MCTIEVFEVERRKYFKYRHTASTILASHHWNLKKKTIVTKQD